MAETGKSDALKLGFLTSIAVTDKGFVGGLLVTNHLGRPLEFQCTAPVRPNRTQEILYGPTLAPFLMGEVIGKTLLEKATVKPTLVLVESPEILDLRAQIAIPLAAIEGDASSSVKTDALRLRVGGQTILFPSTHPEDVELLRARVTQVPAEADLREPFERVRNALQETVQSNAAA